MEIQDNGCVGYDRTLSFSPSRSATPLFEVYIPSLDEEFEVECPKSDLLDHVRDYCQDAIGDGRLDKMPPELTSAKEDISADQTQLQNEVDA